MVSYEVALGLTQFLRNDPDYIIWRLALRSLRDIGNILERSKAREVYKVSLVFYSMQILVG